MMLPQPPCRLKHTPLGLSFGKDRVAAYTETVRQSDHPPASAHQPPCGLPWSVVSCLCY